jgi:hypothetical protein
MDSLKSIYYNLAFSSEESLAQILAHEDFRNLSESVHRIISTSLAYGECRDAEMTAFEIAIDAARLGNASERAEALEWLKQEWEPLQLTLKERFALACTQDSLNANACEGLTSIVKRLMDSCKSKWERLTLAQDICAQMLDAIVLSS